MYCVRKIILTFNYPHPTKIHSTIIDNVYVDPNFGNGKIQVLAQHCVITRGLTLSTI